MKRSQLLYWILSIAVAVPLLYFSMRGIEWARVWTILSGARLSLIAACCGLVSVALFLRAFRWRILLSSEGHVPLRTAFWATAAGYFGNNFLPARAGEIIRTMMVKVHTGLSGTFVLTTALSERMVDAIALVLISVAVLFVLPVKPAWLEDAEKPFAILGIGGVIAIAALPRLKPLGDRILLRLPLPEGIRLKLLHLLEHVVLGIRSFHDGGRLAGFLGLTLVIWCIDATVTVLGAQSLNLDVPYPVAFLLIAGLGLGSALPSTPGYVGVWQFVAVSILTPFGLRRDDAIAYILLFQAMQYLVFGVWGLPAFWQARKLGKAGAAALE